MTPEHWHPDNFREFLDEQAGTDEEVEAAIEERLRRKSPILLKHGDHIGKLAHRYARELQFPKDQLEWAGDPVNLLQSYLVDAALRVTEGDDEAIRKAIDAEMQRLRNDLHKKK